MGKGGKYCAAYGYNNSSNDKGISLHMFPKDPSQRQKGHLPSKLLYFNEDTLQKNMALVKSGTHNLEGKLLIQVLPKCKWK